MVSVNTDKPGVSTYFVGVPDKSFLPAFGGFEAVTEGELPREIDTLLIADGTSDEFNSRFKFKARR